MGCKYLLGGLKGSIKYHPCHFHHVWSPSKDSYKKHTGEAQSLSFISIKTDLKKWGETLYPDGFSKMSYLNPISFASPKWSPRIT